MRGRIDRDVRWHADIAKLRPEQWMLDLLNLSPDYPHWGPGEDYMSEVEEGGGWDKSRMYASWPAFGPWQLDDYNEVAHFYFGISRESVSCGCDGGYHEDALWVAKSFYNHSSPFPRQYPTDETLAKYGLAFRRFCVEMRKYIHWNNRITTDEVAALQVRRRLFHFCDAEHPAPPTAQEVNAAQDRRGCMGHDGINRSILIQTRCERLGVPVYCELCDGRGYRYTAPTGYCYLVLWMLHPRKGASHGLQINNIQQHEVPDVLAFLRTAQQRSIERFSRIPADTEAWLETIGQHGLRHPSLSGTSD